MERYSVWNKQHTRSRKLLMLLLVIATFIIIIATTIGINAKENNKADVCFTSECVEAASKVLKLMNSSVDPCEDFYEFACGGYINETSILGEEYEISTQYGMQNSMLQQLKTMAEEPLHLNEFKPAALVKKYYKSCMNKTLIEEIGLKEIQEILKNVGGWPVVEGRKSNENDFDWKRTIYKLKNIGLESNYLISLSVDIDDKNSSRRILYLGPPYMSPRSDILSKGLKHEYVKAYYDYMVDIAVIFGAEEEAARSELSDVLLFQTLLANISGYSDDMSDITVQKLQMKCSTIPWLEYINTLLYPYEIVTDNEVVFVYSLIYLAKFEKLISQTPTRVQGNYIIWQTVMNYISYLPHKLRNRRQQYEAVFAAEMNIFPRWKECVDFYYTGLEIAASALYVRKYLNQDARQNAQAIVSNIGEQLKHSLKKIDWMDEKTKRYALEKVDAMKAHVGCPIELLDEAKLEEYYQNLELDEKHFLKSHMNISIFDTQKSFQKLRVPVNKTEWTQPRRVINSAAYYLPDENNILLPAGILQRIFFTHGRPNYMNYGSIGYEIGRQMIHGIAGDGIPHGKEGELENWWIPETYNIFKNKAQCIIDKYYYYTVPEIGFNLKSTTALDEGVANIGGLEQAYLAYDRWVRTNGEEPSLPGINYTGRQLFWISTANTRCFKPHAGGLGYERDFIHFKNKNRIVDAFRNQNEFAKDYNCQPNSKMNPIKKCPLL